MQSDIDAVALRVVAVGVDLDDAAPAPEDGLGVKDAMDFVVNDARGIFCGRRSEEHAALEALPGVAGALVHGFVTVAQGEAIFAVKRKVGLEVQAAQVRRPLGLVGPPFFHGGVVGQLTNGGEILGLGEDDQEAVGFFPVLLVLAGLEQVGKGHTANRGIDAFGCHGRFLLKIRRRCLRWG